MLNLKRDKKKYAAKDMKNMKFKLPAKNIHFQKGELDKFGHAMHKQKKKKGGDIHG